MRPGNLKGRLISQLPNLGARNHEGNDLVAYWSAAMPFFTMTPDVCVFFYATQRTSNVFFLLFFLLKACCDWLVVFSSWLVGKARADNNFLVASETRSRSGSSRLFRMDDRFHTKQGDGTELPELIIIIPSILCVSSSSFLFYFSLLSIKVQTKEVLSTSVLLLFNERHWQ